MSSELTERQAFLVLNALPNIGPITLNRLLAELGGDPRAVFAVGRRRLETVKGVGPVISESIETWRELFDLPRDEQCPGSAPHATVDECPCSARCHDGHHHERDHRAEQRVLYGRSHRSRFELGCRSEESNRSQRQEATDDYPSCNCASGSAGDAETE